MQTVTVSQIEERLRQLSEEKLAVVFDFVCYLAERQHNSEALPTLQASEPVLRRPGDSAKDEAEEAKLADLGMSDYLTDLEDYEERLARGEIQW